MKKKRDWICFFSMTGTEIVNIIEDLGRVPDLIVTNKRPSHLREINSKLLKIGEKHANVVELPNKPTIEDYREVLSKFDNPLVSLHGWLRIIPEELCTEYNFFNSHPGLITKYPELAGKDPQVRAFDGIQEGKYDDAGVVLHKVIPEVDKGKVVSYEKFNANFIDFPTLMRTLSDRSLYLWTRFLKNVI